MSTPAGQWNEQQVQAFVDGELDTAETARITALMRQDSTLAESIARQQALRATVQGAFDPVLHEAIPTRLLQAMEGRSGAATPIGAARRPRHGLVAPRPAWWAAAAASVVVAILIGWSLPRDAGGLLVPDQEGLLAGGALAEALSEHTAVDSALQTGVLIAFSIRAEDGRYCRAFSLDSGLDGLACRDERGWLVEAMGRQPGRGAVPPDQYRQAATALAPEVLAATSRWQAGDVLTPQQEQAARSRQWR